MKKLTTINRPNKQSTRVLSCDFSEFIEMMDGVESGRFSGEDYSRNFHGDQKFGESLESAKALLWKGYQPDAMKSAMDGFESEFEATTESVKMTEEGYDFDVPSILSGEDEVWFTKQNQGVAPSIHIVFQANSCAGTSANNFYMQAAVVRKIAEVLSETAHVKASAIYSSENSARKSGENWSTAVCIAVKDFDEAVDERRLGATAHPSFFRRLIFATRDNASKFYGEGFSAHPFCGNTRAPQYVGIDDEFLSSQLGADMTIKIPQPDSEYFYNIDNAVAYCIDVLSKAKSGVEAMRELNFEDSSIGGFC